jgi:hypothetical protein
MLSKKVHLKEEIHYEKGVNMDFGDPGGPSSPGSGKI